MVGSGGVRLRGESMYMCYTCSMRMRIQINTFFLLYSLKKHIYISEIKRYILY